MHTFVPEVGAFINNAAHSRIEQAHTPIAGTRNLWLDLFWKTNKQALISDHKELAIKVAILLSYRFRVIRPPFRNHFRASSNIEYSESCSGPFVLLLSRALSLCLSLSLSLSLSLAKHFRAGRNDLT